MRRIARTIVLGLIFGIVLTLLVALPCGLFVLGWGMSSGGTFSGVLPGGSPRFAPRGNLAVGCIEGFGARQVFVKNGLSIADPGDPTIALAMLNGLDAREQKMVTDAVTSGARAWVGSAVGWPWPAFVCEFSDVQGHDGGWSFISSGGAVMPPVGGPVRVIAWRPLWPGVAYNVLVFAGGVIVIILVPKTTRRANRRRLGLCERCGYDLRATPDGRCPECGFVRKS